MTELRVLTPGDWQLWRRLRLAALAEAPHAFGSTLAEWQGEGDREERWRARLALPGSYNLVAVVDDEPVGMASGVPAEDGSADVELVSMWVAPAARGRGVATALVAAVEDRARRDEATTLRLAVAEGNEAATRLYARHGFTDTGERQLMPDGRRRERVLARWLRDPEPGQGIVVGLATDGGHRFSKTPRRSVRLVAGVGVEGDAHAGAKAQHRSRVRQDPEQPNLRQVHLLGSEFFDLAREHGHEVGVGDFGENVTTTGIDLLALPRDTRLLLGPAAVVRLTGLRNPCRQIDELSAGLLAVAVTRDEGGAVVRRAGVMGVVEADGEVTVGDRVVVRLPARPHEPLDRI